MKILKIPTSAWDRLHIYKIFWPANFHVKLGGEKYEMSQVNLFPPAKQTQSTLIDIDKNMRSEYNGQRNPALG